MRPWKTIERAVTPDGSELTLTQRDDEYAIRVAGRMLMSSREHGSEEAMVKAVESSRTSGPRHWLVGGLGMGFTLRAVLDTLRVEDEVTVAELVPAVVEWNQGLLGELARRPLQDPRVHVYVGDVRRAMIDGRGRYDAILLDVDNGPSALTDEKNDALYGVKGIRTIQQAMRPGGTLVVWSAAHDRRFVSRLERERFRTEVITLGSRGQEGGRRHVLFVGRS